ncbi:MAG: tRNA lysidine(34) synthetase TilS [Terrimonas sp.]|jgi:tRNA(Ile)-lysidine synthase|nr:tRNA lysidine(34) synthetase TilS [Terrimonas sp.]
MDTLSIKQNLEKIAPVLSDDVLLIAISGGLDSVVLTYLCKLAGYPIELAHCNFQLRGEESERDELFVRKLASSWGINVHVQRFDTAEYAAAEQCSVQEAARQLRYEWFNSLAIQYSRIKWILTAHHRDDQAETLLMNFLRGTGLSGLTGIPVRNGIILRPLLSYERRQLEQYALAMQLSFVTDSSNQKEEYTRNYFRHTVIPAIQKVFPSVVENLCDNQVRFTSIEKLYKQLTAVQTQRLLKGKDGEYQFPIAELARFQGTAFLYELLQPFGFTPGQIMEAERLLVARTGAQLVASEGNWRLVKHRKFLILSPQKQMNADFISVDLGDQTIAFPAGKLEFQKIKKVDLKELGSSQVAAFESQHLEFPLQIRRWRAGDYFYPLGMSKKKKVARLLIDLKYSLPEKERVWVLTAGEKIVWVIGIRIDERFKVKDKTQGAIRIAYTPLLQS